MYILVAYDVSTTTQRGRRRLRNVARACLDYGQRVQNSVFECKVSPSEYVAFRARLVATLSATEDSLRIYNLGAGWRHRVEHFGRSEPYDVDGPLVV